MQHYLTRLNYSTRPNERQTLAVQGQARHARLQFDAHFSSVYNSNQSMPVILREKGYELSFVMFDLDEPMHVHVRKERKRAKFWLEPVSLAWTRGYREHELNEIERLINDNQDFICQIWQRESEKRK